MQSLVKRRYVCTCFHEPHRAAAAPPPPLPASPRTVVATAAPHSTLDVPCYRTACYATLWRDIHRCNATTSPRHSGGSCSASSAAPTPTWCAYRRPSCLSPWLHVQASFASYQRWPRTQIIGSSSHTWPAPRLKRGNLAIMVARPRYVDGARGPLPPSHDSLHVESSSLLTRLSL